MTTDSDLKKNPNTRSIQSMFNTPEMPALSHHKQEAITRAICAHIYKDTRPYRTVEMEGFKELLKELCPAYALPCRATITTRIHDMAQLKKEKLKAEVAANHQVLLPLQLTVGRLQTMKPMSQLLLISSMMIGN